MGPSQLLLDTLGKKFKCWKKLNNKSRKKFCYREKQPFSENLKIVGDAQPAQLTPQLHLLSLNTSIMGEDSISLSTSLVFVGICIGIEMFCCVLVY